MNKKEQLTLTKDRIVGYAYRVANTLGNNFSADIYRNALAHDLGKLGQNVLKEQSIEIFYDGQVVGKFSADLLVNGQVVVLIHQKEKLSRTDFDLCRNILVASGLPLGVIINFGSPKLEIKSISNKI